MLWAKDGFFKTSLKYSMRTLLLSKIGLLLLVYCIRDMAQAFDSHKSTLGSV